MRALLLGLVLYVVYHILVTRPLFRIVDDLSEVDPADPGKNLIRTPKGHDRDELDTWVQATNELLSSISETQQKHQDAQDRITRLSRYDTLTGLPKSGNVPDTAQQRPGGGPAPAQHAGHILYWPG